MGYPVTLHFADGVERHLLVPAGETLLDAALGAGLRLAHQCQSGSCGTCICRVEAGEVVMARSTSTALLPREAAAGDVLACLTRIASAAAIRLPYASTLLERAGQARMPAEITALDRLAGTVMGVTLRLDGAPDFSFAPGQYCLLEARQGLARAYSMASIPAELPALRFLVRLLPDGAMSRFWAAAQPGNRISVEGAFGNFALVPSPAPLILVAGGTGLAPMISILDSIAAARRHRAGILLCFGVNRLSELFFLRELEARAALMPKLRLRIAIGEPHAEWGGPTGYVTELLRPEDASPAHLAYLCGPPVMVEAARARLAGFGLAADAIHAEHFLPFAVSP